MSPRARKIADGQPWLDLGGVSEPPPPEMPRPKRKAAVVRCYRCDQTDHDHFAGPDVCSRYYKGPRNRRPDALRPISCVTCTFVGDYRKAVERGEQASGIFETAGRLLYQHGFDPVAALAALGEHADGWGRGVLLNLERARRNEADWLPEDQRFKPDPNATAITDPSRGPVVIRWIEARRVNPGGPPPLYLARIDNPTGAPQDVRATWGGREEAHAFATEAEAETYLRENHAHTNWIAGPGGARIRYELTGGAR